MSPPIGIMALWPFSHRYYESSAYVFMAISRRYWLPEFWTYNSLALGRELLILVPIVALAVRAQRLSRSIPARRFGGRQGRISKTAVVTDVTRRGRSGAGNGLLATLIARRSGPLPTRREFLVRHRLTATAVQVSQGTGWVHSRGSPRGPHVTLAKDTTSNAGISWSKTGRGPYMPTPLAYDGILCVLANNGVLDTYDVATGKEIYRQRLPTIGSGFSASPVAADGKIYLSNEDGEMIIIAAGREFRHIGTNSMGELLMATPALSEGVMYVTVRRASRRPHCLHANRTRARAVELGHEDALLWPGGLGGRVR